MNALLTAGLLLLIGAIGGTSIAYLIAKGPEIVASVFGRVWRSSWPQGVQEDDPPPRWKFDDWQGST
jgi:hypothetical protein